MLGNYIQKVIGEALKHRLGAWMVVHRGRLLVRVFGLYEDHVVCFN
jgi:hypothetical protein